MEHYIDVFLESFIVSTVIPFFSDPSFFAMLSFGGFNMALATCLAVLGTALGALFNFVLGRLLLKLYRRKSNWKGLTTEKYAKFAQKFVRYGVVLLPFSWLPLLNFLVLIAGFFAVSTKLALSLVILGQVARYVWYLFG